MPIIWSQSGVNRKGEPFVQLMVDETTIAQLTPDEARSHARDLLETTEAAEQDAFMLAFAKKTIGTSEEGAIRLIQEFRRWREARGKKSPPSDPDEFMRTDKHRKE